MVGEEDVVDGYRYSGTLKCYTAGILYAIKKNDFCLLKESEESWSKVCHKIKLKKETSTATKLSSPPRKFSKHLQNLEQKDNNKKRRSKMKKSRYYDSF